MTRISITQGDLRQKIDSYLAARGATHVAAGVRALTARQLKEAVQGARLVVASLPKDWQPSA